MVLDYVRVGRPRRPRRRRRPDRGAGALARAILDPAAGTIRRERLSDDHVEFPRIDDRVLTRRHPTIALTGDSGRPRLHPEAADTLLWFDPRTGSTSRWTSPDLAVGELAHAPHPDSDDPDDGWWLTFATHRATGESWLLVIPAADPAAGPQARVRMPVRVPLGLHGAWLPDHPETPPRTRPEEPMTVTDAPASTDRFFADDTFDFEFRDALGATAYGVGDPGMWLATARGDRRRRPAELVRRLDRDGADQLSRLGDAAAAQGDTRGASWAYLSASAAYSRRRWARSTACRPTRATPSCSRPSAAPGAAGTAMIDASAGRFVPRRGALRGHHAARLPAAARRERRTAGRRS